MHENEKTIRALYALAEGEGFDIEQFVGLFAHDGYMRDIPTGMVSRGAAIGDAINGLAQAFPDIHRELFNVYAMGSVVVAELAIRGTNTGDIVLPSGTVAATGKSVDVPCCDVFHVENGKVTVFHCYNAASVMAQQLGFGGP